MARPANTIKIQRDTDAESPREWDNVGTMIAFHKRYDLGDKDHGYRCEDYNGWDEMEAAIVKDNPGCVILPLYLYDHSGITMKTTPFSCRWDSGQVGFIFASAKKIRECFMVKRITAKVRQKALASLVSEVEVYDQYLRGEVYGFTIEGGEHDGDSCWGFFGDDPFTNGMSEHIPTELHGLLKEASVSY